MDPKAPDSKEGATNPEESAGKAKTEGRSPDPTTVISPPSGSPAPGDRSAAGTQPGQPEICPPAPASLLGSTLGSIRIVEVLGKGGMGEVYLGFDEKLDRKVALKALRGDRRMDERARARFTREAKLLSQLEHPHICRVYDLLSGPEQDFLVMEYVKGQSLREAMGRPMTRPQKLKVAEQVAGVLAASHEKAIIHRDLKHENIMLTEAGDVKVLDFGLARSVAEYMAPTVELDSAPSLTSGSAPVLPGETRVGSIVGTVGYMSPEQARGEPATPASDVYALGLLIQELFTGERPFDKALPVPELIEKAARGETRPFKDEDPDLVALVNRLKSVAPAARPSAVDVAERLRWIQDKPRRRRLRIVEIAAVLVLVALTGAMIALAVKAKREADRANREAETAEQVSTFLTGLFKVVDPSQSMGERVTARAVLDQGARKIERDLSGQPLVQATLMATMGDVYQSLGLFPQAEPLLTRALDTREKLLGEDHAETASSLNALGSLYFSEGRYAEARPLYERSLTVRERLFGPQDYSVGQTVQNLALLDQAEGKLPEAGTRYRRSLAIMEKSPDADDADRVWAILHLAGCLSEEGKPKDAELLYTRARALADEKLGPAHPDTAAAYNNSAAFYAVQGNMAQAEPLLRKAIAVYEKALGPEHPVTAGGLNNLAGICFMTGRTAEAEPLFVRSIAIREKTLGPDHPDTIFGYCNLAHIYTKQNRLKEAEPLYAKVAEGKGAWTMLANPNVSGTLENYVTLLRMTGRGAEADGLEARLRAAMAQEK